jgi:hypothetical protein
MSSFLLISWRESQFLNFASRHDGRPYLLERGFGQKSVVNTAGCVRPFTEIISRPDKSIKLGETHPVLLSIETELFADFAANFYGCCWITISRLGMGYWHNDGLNETAVFDFRSQYDRARPILCRFVDSLLVLAAPEKRITDDKARRRIGIFHFGTTPY